MYLQLNLGIYWQTNVFMPLRGSWYVGEVAFPLPGEVWHMILAEVTPIV